VIFIQAGLSTVRFPDGSERLPEELWDFLPSIQGSAGAILGAVEADAAVNLGIVHRSLRAFADNYERLDVDQLQRLARETDVALINAQGQTGQRTLEMAAVLKRTHPGIAVIVGGPFPTLDPDEALTPDVDYLVRYDGCVAACGLLRALSANLAGEELSGYLQEVPNLFYRDRASEEVVRTPKMKVNARTGAPLPPVVSTSYYSKAFRERIVFLSLGASTGCPHHCQMCISCRISSLARRPPEHVVADLRLLHQLGDLEPESAHESANVGRFAMGQLLYWMKGEDLTRYNLREIFLWDDNLTHGKNRDYALEVFRGMAAFYREAGLRPALTTMQVGVDFFDSDEVLAAAHAAGIRRVCCGFETISRNALRLMGKKAVHYEEVEEQYRRAVQAGRAHGIAVLAYLMVGFNEEPEDIASMGRFFQEIGVASVQVLFQVCWNKKWVALDIPEVGRQPLADINRLQQQGRVPGYRYDENGRVIETLLTAGLMPTHRAEKMDYETLFRLRRRVYEEFYSPQNILEVWRNRDRYPDWASTIGSRLLARYRYLKQLDEFTERYGVMQKLRRAEAEYRARGAS
jgi:radical SAM superfamily enzyme YgiQ (UPF0313 family)